MAHFPDAGTSDCCLSVFPALDLRLLPSSDKCDGFAKQIIAGLGSLELLGIMPSGTACIGGFTVDASDVVKWDFSGCAWYQAVSPSAGEARDARALPQYTGRRLYESILDEQQCRLPPIRS